VTRSISGEDTGDQPHELLFRVTDPNFGYANWTRLVTVRNLDPVIESLEVTPPREGALALGDELVFAVDARDPGYDPMTFLWDLDGDGVYDDHNGATGSFLFDDPQLLSIGVMVEDGDGGVAMQRFALTAVPEPATAVAMLLSMLGFAAARPTRASRR
jgi:hypothetical protein